MVRHRSPQGSASLFRGISPHARATGPVLSGFEYYAVLHHVHLHWYAVPAGVGTCPRLPASEPRLNSSRRHPPQNATSRLPLRRKPSESTLQRPPAGRDPLNSQSNLSPLPAPQVRLLPSAGSPSVGLHHSGRVYRCLRPGGAWAAPQPSAAQPSLHPPHTRSVRRSHASAPSPTRWRAWEAPCRPAPRPPHPASCASPAPRSGGASTRVRATRGRCHARPALALIRLTPYRGRAGEFTGVR